MKENLLSQENISFADTLAYKFGRSILGDLHEKSITMDDLRQESFLGLYEAAQRYDESLGVEFTSLAYIWCRKFVLRAVRKYGSPLTVPDNFEGEVELLHFDLTADDAAVSTSADDDGSLEDRILYQMALAEEREREAEEERKEIVERALQGLTDKERRAIACLFALSGEELSGLETAAALGVVPGRVSQIKERALRKLERALAA